MDKATQSNATQFLFLMLYYLYIQLPFALNAKGGDLHMPKKNKKSNKQQLNVTAIILAIIKLVQEIVIAWIENR